MLPKGTQSEELISKGQNGAAVWVWGHCVRIQRGRYFRDSGWYLAGSTKVWELGTIDTLYILNFMPSRRGDGNPEGSKANSARIRLLL